MPLLRLVLGDQLNARHSWFKEIDGNVTYLLMEMRQETDYATHHIQKIVAFFAAMRSFAEQLKEQGHTVIYLALNDPHNHHTLGNNVEWAIRETGSDRFEYLLPDEYRLDVMLKVLCESLDVDTGFSDTEHFLTRREFLGSFFDNRKSWRMESFYRFIRKEYDLLMEGGDPVGGKWNYDQENRKKLPKGDQPPDPLEFDQDIGHLVDMIEDAGVNTIGRIDPKHFLWPTTRDQGLELLEFFVTECLPQFGTYQDAMTPDYWSLYHSRLSFVLNSKLLGPLEVIHRAVIAWENNPERVSLSQIEGFVRQIAGWREYMRGVYWDRMPGYRDLNYFDHQRKLPDFFWTGETKMACVSHAVSQSLDHAYAHHIQRLMVTGNFALLAGIDPDQVDDWYLGIYIDALEWVEITNTRGMSQFADGGIVGTKPYVSSANYMHKMSHYCGDCHYNHKDRTGDQSCPFNSLYWHFHARHADKLGNNPRIGMAYRTLNKMDDETRSAMMQRAEWVIDNLETL